MQGEFGGVDELSHGKIFRAYLVNAKLLLLVNVSCNNRLDKKFTVDVHGQYFVVLSTHDDMSPATLNAGIEVIFTVLALQPSEITA